MKFTAFPFADAEWEHKDIEALQEKVLECSENVDISPVRTWVDYQLTQAMQAAVTQTTDAFNLKLAVFEEQSAKNYEEMNEKLKAVNVELAELLKKLGPKGI